MVWHGEFLGSRTLMYTSMHLFSSGTETGNVHVHLFSSGTETGNVHVHLLRSGTETVCRSYRPAAGTDDAGWVPDGGGEREGQERGGTSGRSPLPPPPPPSSRFFFRLPKYEGLCYNFFVNSGVKYFVIAERLVDLAVRALTLKKTFRT